MQKLFILALCVASAVAGTAYGHGLTVSSIAPLQKAAPTGVVSVIRCGGIGTFLQLRVDGCEGNTCTLIPGTTCLMEEDFIPATASTYLRIKIDVVIGGQSVPIVDSTLPNSSVQQGVAYTIKFAITPNDVLSGQFITVRANIFDSSERVQTCVEVPVAIQ